MVYYIQVLTGKQRLNMTLYEKLCTSSLDISVLGFVPCQDHSVLGTTPDGKVIFTEESLVCANGVAVAKNFADFLGLLCCADAPLLAQAPNWTCLRFQRELMQQGISRKQQMVRTAVKNSFHPTSIADPYGYIRSLHSIPNPQKSQLDTAVPFGKTIWHAKAAEIHADHAEVWVCVEIPGQDILAYYDCWEGVIPDAEQALLKNAQDPFALHCEVTAIINGVESKSSITEVARWDPLADNDATAAHLLHQFGLDMEQGWVFLQLGVPYQSKKKKRLRSLSLQLDPTTITVPGPRLTTPVFPGEVKIHHPVTRKPYTLTIHSCTQEGLDPNFLTNPPCFYTRMCYYLTPALGEDVFQIFDSVPNDRLLPPPGASVPYPDPELEDAPTAKLAEIDETLPTHIRTAFSARHYKERTKVQWLTRFRYTPAAAAVLSVIR